MIQRLKLCDHLYSSPEYCDQTFSWRTGLSRLDKMQILSLEQARVIEITYINQHKMLMLSLCVREGIFCFINEAL